MVDDKYNIGKEHELIEKIKRGDYGSFEHIYNLFYPSLYRYACQFSGIKEYVHDSIQDLFIDLWNGKEKLHIKWSLQAYLFKSLRYKIQYQLKKEQAFSRSISEYLKDSFELFFDEEAYLHRFEVEREVLQQLRKSVQELAPKQRELIYLIFFSNLSYDEASKITGIAKKTAYNQVHSAIKNLRVSMEDLIFLIPLLFV